MMMIKLQTHTDDHMAQKTAQNLMTEAEQAQMQGYYLMSDDGYQEESDWDVEMAWTHEDQKNLEELVENQQDLPLEKEEERLSKDQVLFYENLKIQYYGSAPLGIREQSGLYVVLIQEMYQEDQYVGVWPNLDGGVCGQWDVQMYLLVEPWLVQVGYFVEAVHYVLEGDCQLTEENTSRRL